MRIRISHSISYDYAEPARHITQILRLTPRDHDGQHVMSWRIEPNIDGRMRSSQDAHGNIVHSFYADGPISALSIKIDGLIETVDLAGVVRGGIERVPSEVYRRDTLLTTPDEALRGFALEATSQADTPLSRMHALMDALHTEIACVDASGRIGIGAAAAFAAREGIAQDIAHVFMTCARQLGMPARYVSGYVAQSDTLPHANGAHAWAEVYFDDYGWIGFDPANGLCPIDTHVRVAAGLDFADAAPVRGARKGGDGENLAVLVSARETDSRLVNQ
ncbi:transglutaminase family protein [Bosea lathyri]|jgi:transglutaminase-like putative cysteine protease|uniref:Transglutaminase-like enzyme, putative cysteine protease n=1 Tax=Bosea lathyri TaxID=1036778 RepID=A0A1H5XW83_9HYPH|nr:transglutaminase family protein [Bosea lathyri]SEG15516.1 Transglutaminase-like enzyme, putative cysteine protease [Bosea lathyri]